MKRKLYEGNRMVRNKAKDSGGDSATGNYIWEEGNWTYYTHLYDKAGRVKEATGMSKNVTTIYTIEYACK